MIVRHDRRATQILCWLTHPEVACWNLNTRQTRRLAAELPEAAVRRVGTCAAFRRALPEAQVAMIWQFDPTWLAEAPGLTWIATPSAGRDYFVPPQRLGLTLTYGTFHGQIIGESVAAMVLAESRGLLAASRLQAGGASWPQAALASRMRRVRGTHAVIIGFGHIGQWIGRLLKPFGVRITGVRRRLRAPRPDYLDRHDRVVGPALLNRVLRDADHVILALPGGAATNHLLDRCRLALLPTRAAVYNVGRGNAVDEAALMRRLQSGRLRAACLDVFTAEPLPAGDPLTGTPGVWTTPHATAIAPDYLDLFLDEFVALFRAGAGGCGRQRPRCRGVRA